MKSSRASRKVAVFRLAFLCALLVMASLNALSYFVRSRGWGGLLGRNVDGREAIGFPWLAWEEGGSWPVEYLGLAGNIAVAVAVSLLFAATAIMLEGRLPLQAFFDTKRDLGGPVNRRFQYSLRSLLLLTAAAAVVAGVARSFSNIGSALLATAYLFGPAIILSASYCMRWAASVWGKTLISLAVTLLLTTVLFVGATMGGIDDFTKVLLGLFVCWVPQCVLIVAVLYVWQYVAAMRKK